MSVTIARLRGLYTNPATHSLSSILRTTTPANTLNSALSLVIARSAVYVRSRGIAHIVGITMTSTEFARVAKEYCVWCYKPVFENTAYREETCPVCKHIARCHESCAVELSARRLKMPKWLVAQCVSGCRNSDNAYDYDGPYIME